MSSRKPKLVLLLVGLSVVFSVWLTWGGSRKEVQDEMRSDQCGDNFTEVSEITFVKSLLAKRAPKFRKEDCSIFPGTQKLTAREIYFKEKCIQNFKLDHAHGSDQFWSGDTQYIRHTHHKYLTSQSLVLDVGGNKGEDADAMIQAFHPGIYVILEPINSLFTKLTDKFKSQDNVILYNFGLAAKDDTFFVNVVGHGGDATSVFTGNKGGKCNLKVYNTTQFMQRLGVPCYDVDLITINCEGCEFEILETLIASGLISHFQHVQFATHPLLTRLEKPVERYCEIQQKLARTHMIEYQYKFCWETWKRKDIKRYQIKHWNLRVKKK